MAFQPKIFDSDYNGDGALKQSHDQVAKAIRVTSTGLPFGANRFIAEMDDDGCGYKSITYYADIIAEKTSVTFISDVASSLNDKYFILYSGRDLDKYYVWYNVDGAGTDPAIAGFIGVEVELLSNDQAAIVAMATRNALNPLNKFSLTLAGNILKIQCNKKGFTTNTSDGISPANTSFTIVEEMPGVTEVKATITLEYDVDGNVIGYEQE